MSFSEALQNSMSGERGELKRMKAAEVRLHNVANAEKRFVNFFKKTAAGQSVLGRLKLYLDDLDSRREQVFLTVDSVNVAEFVNRWASQSFIDKQSFLNEYVRQVLVKDRSVRVLI